MKIDKRDTVFSRLIRERAEWTCERCGAGYPVGAQGLHCSHIFSRRGRSTRWDPINAVAHCFSCHMWFQGHPIYAAAWAEKHIGAGPLAALERRYRTPMKLTKRDLEEIHASLKASYATMMAARDRGATGRLEFESPYSEVFA